MSAPTMTYVVRGKINANNEWVNQQMLFNPPADSFRVAADHYGSRFCSTARAISSGRWASAMTCRCRRIWLRRWARFTASTMTARSPGTIPL
jgi:hypothetical protein